jgi:uncharacterized protein YwgA
MKSQTPAREAHMTHADPPLRRVAALTKLVEMASPNPLGRTAVMKLAYFLKVVRGVPIDYEFRLYTYGPFCTDILEDLQYAASLGSIRSELITFPSGYGYFLTVGPEAKSVLGQAEEFIQKYHADFEWVVKEFSGYSASQLELISTIVFVEREARKSNHILATDEIVKQVVDLKPHFSTAEVEEKISKLVSMQLIKIRS